MMWFSYLACCSCRDNGGGGFSFDIRKSYYICSSMFVCSPSIFFHMFCNYAYCWKPGCSVYHQAHKLCLCFGRYFVEEPVVFDTRNTICGKESPEKHARRKKPWQMLHLVLWQTCSEGTIFRLFLEISCNPILCVLYYRLFWAMNYLHCWYIWWFLHSPVHYTH